jgi:hypothetical protein
LWLPLFVKLVVPLPEKKIGTRDWRGIWNRPIQVRYLPSGFFKISIRVEKGRKHDNIDTRNYN